MIVDNTTQPYLITVQNASYSHANITVYCTKNNVHVSVDCKLSDLHKTKAKCITALKEYDDVHNA